MDNRAFQDAGNFMTAIFVVSGLAIPALLAHIKVIEIGALLMSISGGIVVYGTILVRFSINMQTNIFMRRMERHDVLIYQLSPLLSFQTNPSISNFAFIKLCAYFLHLHRILCSCTCMPSTTRRRKNLTKCIRCNISRINGRKINFIPRYVQRHRF